jgi:hypothetical protein
MSLLLIERGTSGFTQTPLQEMGWQDSRGPSGAARFTKFAAEKPTPKLSVRRAACYDMRPLAGC